MPKKYKNGKVTLDKLAAMVAKGFGDVYRQLNDIDERLGGIEHDVQNYDFRFYQLNNSILNLEKAINKELRQLKNRTSFLEKRVFSRKVT